MTGLALFFLEGLFGLGCWCTGNTPGQCWVLHIVIIAQSAKVWMLWGNAEGTYHNEQRSPTQLSNRPQGAAGGSSRLVPEWEMEAMCWKGLSAPRQCLWLCMFWLLNTEEKVPQASRVSMAKSWPLGHTGTALSSANVQLRRSGCSWLKPSSAWSKHPHKMPELGIPLLTRNTAPSCSPAPTQAWLPLTGLWMNHGEPHWG